MICRYFYCGSFRAFLHSSQVDWRIGGLGERSGQVQSEEVPMTLKDIFTPSYDRCNRPLPCLPCRNAQASMPTCSFQARLPDSLTPDSHHCARPRFVAVQRARPACPALHSTEQSTVCGTRTTHFANRQDQTN